MASNPPFNVEDQTDEDFFDKLVDDDFSPNEAISSSSSGIAVKFIADNDSDDAKAFANLNIGEGSGADYKMNEAKTGNDSEDVGVVDSVDAQPDKETDASLLATEAEDFDRGESSFNPVNQEDQKNVPASESTGEIENDKSEGLGIKEVGWSSFYADSSDNGVHGVGSYSDFFTELGENVASFNEKVDENVFGGGNIIAEFAGNGIVGLDNSVIYEQHHDTRGYSKSVDQSLNGQNLNDSEYWENMYPGWKYDANTGQWVHVDGQDATKAAQVSYENPASDWDGVSDGKLEVAYLRQSTPSAVGKVVATTTTESVSNLNQVSQANTGYPEHMIFDPQYPGWYYDAIAQEWRSLDVYNAAAQPTVQAPHGQVFQNAYNSTQSVYGEHGQIDKLTPQGLGSQIQHDSWSQSHRGYDQQGTTMWQPEGSAATGAAFNPATLSSFGGNHLVDRYFGVGQQPSTVQTFEKASQPQFGAPGIAQADSFVSDIHLSHQVNAVNAQYSGSLSSCIAFSQNSVDVAQQRGQMSLSSDFYGSRKPLDVGQQAYQSSQQFSYASSAGRSPDGRPAHALVAFGFGGKLIVMKDSSSSLHNSSFGSQGVLGSTVSVLNVAEVVTGDAKPPSFGDTPGYFHALCQQSVPGPLVGGSVGNKEINKWLDESIANCESPDMGFSKGNLLKLLLSLLKISCQHYGKLRSPFGADTMLKESDTPEAAVAKLFTSAKNNAYGALSQCLQQLPPEAQMLATASEVQNLLVSGRKMEALRCAQDGQLWGPALVIATQLGDQFYIDTMKQMALRQLVSGSPLRTLCLLIAGQPAEVFSTGNIDNGDVRGSMNVAQYESQLQSGINYMLDNWEENLAIITANRTKDDELVITHLGDCLWRERSEVVAAHICYLVAEKSFEPFSDAARLCLVGADHWKFPRTYASPEAIQRTELYEYSKVLGNSQYILVPFQPYKLLYAHMLAEVGKVADALKYCQAVTKSLKTGRAPEAETWKQLVLSLEERIRIYQQGGYTANLAPTKLVGKLLTFFDNTAHRVVGGLPPPVPAMSHVQPNEFRHQQAAPRVSSSQSTMTMSSLMPSASMEPISQWAGDGSRMAVPSRSVSEPDFGRTPRQDQAQADSSNEKSVDGVSDKASDSRTASRFGRFGFGSRLIKKTVGLVIRSKPSHEAKLGEKNKFYYDEKLKRWVEEGVETPAEEAALPPPPTTATFMSNNVSDHGNKPDLKNEMPPSGGTPNFSSPTPSENSSVTPPIPGGSNQFSARGRMGVRARYVDTFNQGRGNSANMFQSPSAPLVKPAMPANAKFFVPAPAATPGEQGLESISESAPEYTTVNETASATATTKQLQAPISSSPMGIQRFPSMDNIKRSGSAANVNHSLPLPHSRRTASWSGSINGAFSPPAKNEVKPLEALGMPPSTFTPRSHGSSSSLGDDLHEVEL